VVDGDQQVCGVLATVIETTAQFQAERARAEHETQLKLLNAELDDQRAQLQRAHQRLVGDLAFLSGMFEQAPGFMALVLGPDHVIQLANASYQRLVGERDIVGKPVRLALPEMADQGFVEILDEVYVSGEPFYGKNRDVMVASENGAIKRVILDFVYQPLKDSDGHAYGIFVEGFDVSARAMAEERLRVAQEAGEVGTFEWYPGTGEVVVSDAYRRVWGLDPATVVTSELLLGLIDPHCRHLSGPERLDRHANPLEYAEFQITRADSGERRWIARKGQALGQASDGHPRYLGVVFDITDRKQAEESLRRADQRLRESLDFMHLLLDSTEEAFCAADRDGATTLCNAAFLRMFGHASAAEVLGRPLGDVIRWAPAADAACPMLRPMHTGEVARGADQQFLRSDGSPFPAAWRAGPVVRDGQLHGVVCTITDLTDQKEQDAALRASETRLATVFRQASVGLSEASLTGRLTRVNNALCSMLGRTRQELVGMQFTEIIHPDDRQASLDATRELIRHGSPLASEKRYLRPDGGVVWAYTSVSRVLDARGEPQALIAVTTDLTERRKVEQALRELNESLERKVSQEVAERVKAEDALRQAQKMEAIGQLASGVAHDFNNVLQIVSSNLQLMELDPGVSALLRSRLAHAVAAVERGAKLSSQLLAFARRQPLQPVVTHLGQLLRNIEPLLQRALGDHASLDIEVMPGLWSASVDPNQIENAILNMAINARDAMRGTGRVAIRVANVAVAGEAARGATEYVSLSISDTGCGMSREVLDKVFDPFYTTKEPGKGTGLGMSMVYGFVKQSGGEIRIDSSPGMGTTITIDLPRARGAEAIPAGRSANAVAGGDETILVVEDDPAVRSATIEILASLGYRALKAENGQQALAIVQSGMPIDLLFTDVFMPGGSVDSVELVAHVRRIAPAAAILLTSGNSLDAALPGREMLAGIELLPKPYGREQLALKIRQLLGARPDGVAPTPATHDEELGRPGSGQLGFLVVEDERDARELACEMLIALGHGAQGAASAEQALALLGEQRFDVLFTDLNLPGMNGAELAARACEIAPGIDVVLASGDGAVPIAAGDCKVAQLPKPYDLLQLQLTIDAIAGRRQDLAA
jgi:PAS domain S-box-containing protein